MEDPEDSEGAGVTTPEKKLGFARELEVIDPETGVRHAVAEEDLDDSAPPSIMPPTPASSRPEWYEELTEEQISMFKEMFEMLDRDGGGTLDAAELCKVMAELDIEASREEIEHVLKDLDKDGNGEIDFDEFLYAMSTLHTEEASNDSQVDGSESYTRRQRLFFTAITRFAMKNSMGEIERYYSNRMRQAPHVISFYTAGVRLIGLNDRQLELCLRNMQKTAQNQDSPYAKPLPFVNLSNNRKKNKLGKKKKRRGQRKPVAVPPAHSGLTPMTTPIATLPAAKDPGLVADGGGGGGGGGGGVVKEMASVERSSSVDYGRILENSVQNKYTRRRSAMTPDSVDIGAIMRLLRELADRGSVMAKLPDVHLIPAVRAKIGQMLQSDPPPSPGEQHLPINSTMKRRRTLGSSGGRFSAPLSSRASTLNSASRAPRASLSTPGSPISPSSPPSPCASFKSRAESGSYSSQRGWMIPRIDLGITLPVISISSKTDKFTVEDVPAIRARVSHALSKYYSALKRAHVKLLNKEDMESTMRNIRSGTLRENFSKVICAYTPQKEDNIYVVSPWRPAPRYTSRQAGKPLSQYLAPPPSTVGPKSWAISRPLRRPASRNSAPSTRPPSICQ